MYNTCFVLIGIVQRFEPQGRRLKNLHYLKKEKRKKKIHYFIYSHAV